jgi:hypothetical protein
MRFPIPISLIPMVLFACAGAMAAPASKPPPPEIRLDAGMAFLPHDAGVIIAVGPELRYLVSHTLPKPGDSATDIAAAYGMALRPFGNIRACGPAMMTVPNAHPDRLDLYTNIPTGQAITHLVAALDDGQWAMLIGLTGLGQSDLNTDEQKFYFNAILPDQVGITPQTDYARNVDQAKLQDVTDREKWRLRLSQTVEMEIPFGEDETTSAPIPDEPTSLKRYSVATQRRRPNQESQFGVALLSTESNSEKHGDLDLSIARFDKLISVTEAHTVGDVIAAVAKGTGLEIYADARYEARSVHVYGGASTVPARDLLHALAFCVTGAYRKVGPAYVLTDDVAGYGARMTAIANYQKQSVIAQSETARSVSETTARKHRLKELSFVDDPLALSQPQIDQMDVIAANAFNIFQAQSLKLPTEQLTPAQRVMALRIYQKVAKQVQDSGHPEWGQPRLTGNMTLTPTPILSILSPSVDGPIIYDRVGVAGIFYRVGLEGSSKPRFERAMKRWKEGAAKPVAPLADTLVPFTVRAVLVHPRSAKELDTVLDAMGPLGFNQLWLAAYTEGHACTVVNSLDDPAELRPVDLLAHALARTKGTGVSILPVFSLLRWGDSSPNAALDIDILGETVFDYARRLESASPPTTTEPAQAWFNLRGSEQLADLQDGWVSPFSSSVVDTLKDAVSGAAAHKGIAGIVCRDVAANGDLPVYVLASARGGSAFGYTADARLAFLRQEHADPIDIAEDEDSQMLLPEFNGNKSGMDADRRLVEKWKRFRSKTTQDMLAALAGVVDGPDAGTARQIYIKQKDGPRTLNSAYKSWTNHKSTAPGVEGLEPPQQQRQQPAGSGAPASPTPDSSITVASLPMRYVLVPEYNLEQISSIPDEKAGDGAAASRWILDLNRTAPLTVRRIADAIRPYANGRAQGILLDLTPEGGIDEAIRQFAGLARTQQAGPAQ